MEMFKWGQFWWNYFQIIKEKLNCFQFHFGPRNSYGHNEIVFMIIITIVRYLKVTYKCFHKIQELKKRKYCDADALKQWLDCLSGSNTCHLRLF